MAFIKGDERILYIKVADVFVPVGCLLSNNISESSETLDTTTRQNNGWRTSVPVTQSYSIEFEGIQILTTGSSANNDKLSYDTLKLIKRNRERVEWKIQDSDLNFIDVGYGYIIEIGESNQVGELLSFSGKLEGFGVTTSSSTPGIYLFEDGEPYLFEDTRGYQFEF